MQTNRRRVLQLIGTASVAAAVVPLSAPAGAAATGVDRYPTWVEPIRRLPLGNGTPRTAAAELSSGVLSNATRYTVRTWFPARYGSQTGRYLDLGGTGEQNVRPPGGAALGLAVQLATDTYPGDITAARDVAIRLVASLANGHAANRLDGGWGSEWQSPLWAADAGTAGWLLWTDLAPEDRLLVERMVTHEADRLLTYQVPYYQRPDGTIVTPGDSKAEENAWNATLLNLAVSMMPDHPNASGWQQKALELMVSAYSRPSDLSNETRVNGTAVRQWLHGSNIFEDGTLVNHGIIHPDYMCSITQITSAPLAYALAGLPTPRAAFFNADLVYGALVNKVFDAPPYRDPGGTIFRTDADGRATQEIYYPQGNDWGTARRMQFALMSTEAALFGFDGEARVPAADWAAAHLGQVLAMQGRFTDGRTYGATAEDTYAGREQWVSQIAARAYLAHWLDHQDVVSFSNRSYPATPPAVDLQTTVPGYLIEGQPTAVTVSLTNSGPYPMMLPTTEFALPDGWSAVQQDAFPDVLPAGRSAGTTWLITAHGTGSRIRTTVSYQQRGRSRMTFTATAVAVAPPPPTGTVWLSDLDWVQAKAMYPPVRDANNYAEPLSLNGITYPKGLWLEIGYLEYYLGGWSGRLVADLGIDDAMERRFGPDLGSVTYQVWLDGVQVYDSGLVTGADDTVRLDIPVPATQVLRLVVTDGGDGTRYDWADWCGAQLIAE